MIGKISVSATIRNLLRFAVLLLTAGALSCVRGEEIGAPEETADATLRVSTRSAVMRADAHFEDDPFAEGKEEAIRRISLFFFDDAASTEPAFFTYDADASDETTADLTVKIPAHLLAGKTAAYVYALVNLPETVKVDKSTGEVSVLVADGEKKYGASLDGLKSVWVNDDRFAAQGSVPGSFVMRGGAAVSVAGTGSGSTVAGTVFVERLASKIRLWADIEKTVYVDTETGKTIDPQDDGFQEKMAAGTVEEWRSVTDGQDKVRLYLHNLATRGRIGGYSDGTYFGSGYTDDDYSGREEALDYANVDRSKDEVARTLVTGLSLNETDINGGGAKAYPFTHAVAYYSYPNIWNSTSQAEKFQTYMLVSVLWERDTDDGDKEYQTCWYQVPVNALRGMTQTSGEADRLDPNRYYRIKVHIGMLGSMNPGEAPELDASYEIVDWETQEVNVDIKDRRYLVVNQTDWVMNNASSIEIPFSTSHRTEIVECYVNYFRYVGSWGYSPYSTAVKKSDENNTEFAVWKKLGGENEGFYESSYGKLYCKPRYFIGDYYVGREHPYTIDPEKKARDAKNNSTEDEEAWDLYQTKYQLDSLYSCVIDHDKSIIKFYHPLVLFKKNGNGVYVPDLKNGKLQDEYSRCEIIIKIKHADYDNSKDHLYEETVYITQYPGIYVEEDHNYGSENTSGANNNPYAMANGIKRSNTSSSLSTFFQRMHSCIDGSGSPSHDGSNNNPNMYVIHVTQLSEEDENKYVIGDPRTLYYNNELISYNSENKRDYNGFLADIPGNEKKVTVWSGPNLGDVNYVQNWNNWVMTWRESFYENQRLSEADRLNESGTGLSYYYPTDESTGVGSKENYIAPILRIASSFGKASVGSKEEFRRRCATYQEAGRPAGRWRLPTMAEIQFIAELSANNKIPILLGSDVDPTLWGYYWTAQGGLRVNGKGEVQTKVDDEGNLIGDPGANDAYKNAKVVVNAARCVYDEWYWVKEDGTQDVIPEDTRHNETNIQPKDEYWGHVTTFYWGDRKKDNTQVDPKVSTRKYVNPNNTVAR